MFPPSFPDNIGLRAKVLASRSEPISFKDVESLSGSGTRMDFARTVSSDFLCEFVSNFSYSAETLQSLKDVEDEALGAWMCRPMVRLFVTPKLSLVSPPPALYHRHQC